MAGGEDMLEATAIILAGGKNTRMGCHKAFLEIGRQKIIERTVAQLSGLFAQVLVAGGEPSAYAFPGVEAVGDIIPGLGPLSGIHAGLTAAHNQYSLVLACDMPFVEAGLAVCLVREAPGFDVVVPQINQRLQPLFAVYSRDCLAPVARCLESRISRVTAFYHQVRVKYVAREKIALVADVEKVFYNVNTPADLAMARRLVDVSRKG